jgi:acyl-CoA dehydrogenase
MIDFSLTEEQKALKNLASEFAVKEILPKAAFHDETGQYPHEILRKAWKLGLMNIHVPAKFGGLGLSAIEGILIAEEIAYACTGIGTAMEANNLAQAPVIITGNDIQKEKFLRPMTENYSLAAYCVTEPGAGSDVQGIRMTAEKSGNNYILNGEKMWITNASVAEWYFVLAYTEKNKGYKGMSAFIVQAKSPGIHVGKKEKNMGQRASDTHGISFVEVKVPKENLLGKEGDGFKIAMKAFDHTRPLIAAAALGLTRRALDEAIKYSKERKTFGHPIYKHQAVSFMIADVAKDLEATRLLTWKAAWMIDNDKRNTLLAAMAKAKAADLAMRAATDTVQIFGGYGYSSEFPVEKLMRDAKIFQIYEGTSQIQRLIIAKELFERS